jgi:hypothetical protein
MKIEIDDKLMREYVAARRFREDVQAKVAVAWQAAEAKNSQPDYQAYRSAAFQLERTHSQSLLDETRVKSTLLDVLFRGAVATIG